MNASTTQNRVSYRTRRRTCLMLALAAAAGFAALSATAPAAQAQKYRAVVLHNASGAFRHSSARGIHNNTTVGFAWNDDSFSHLRVDGQIDLYPDSEAGARNDGPRDAHAARWQGDNPASFTDIHPTNLSLYGSQAHGIQGDKIVGCGFYYQNFGDGPLTYSSALLWSRTDSAATELAKPPGNHNKHARALGVDGERAAGWNLVRSTDETESGMLWPLNQMNGYKILLGMGTDNNAQPKYTRARTYAVQGNRQFGYAKGPGTMEQPHAAMWTEDGAKFTDVNPPGYTMSVILGAHGSNEQAESNEQVGYGMFAWWENAILWKGTTVINLIPGGVVNCRAQAVRFGRQVGYATFWENNYTHEGNAHAMVWASHANKYRDLHSLLPTNYVASRAYGIDEVGPTAGQAGSIVGEAVTSDGFTHAVLWVADAAQLQSITGSVYSSRATFNISLDGWAPTSGATITLRSNNSLVRVPSSVTILDGVSTAVVNGTADRYGIGSSYATVSATYNGVTKSCTVRIR